MKKWILASLYIKIHTHVGISKTSFFFCCEVYICDDRQKTDTKNCKTLLWRHMILLS